MIDLETINSMWEKDSKIDDIMLDQTTIRIPQLHQKYLSLHGEFKLLLAKKNQELKKVQHSKWLYYSGKAKPEVYEDKPFDYKVMKSDVPSWIAVDEDINRLEMQVEYYKTTLDTLSEILKQVHQLSYSIGNMIKWRMFTNGGI
jgi:hypothetical protein